jgi:hypothetical protein
LRSGGPATVTGTVAQSRSNEWDTKEQTLVIFFTVFVLSFISADYVITGSVTNTWIAIAILFGLISGLVRKAVVTLAGGSDVKAVSRTEQKI